MRTSYILTTRNRARFLDDALRNAAEYVGQEDELIVMDGGSSDDTADVVESHANTVSLFISERDHGEAHGLNKGILASRGRYLKLLTDDDYYYPDAMRRAIAVLDEHPEIDALLCGGEEYVVEAVSDPTPQLRRFQRVPPTRSLLDDARNVQVLVSCGIGLVLRRRAIELVGLFDPAFYAVDMDYLGRLVASGVALRYLDVKLWRHVNHPGSGENNVEKCEWDRIRTDARSHAWVNVLRQPSYRVDRVFGLDQVPAGATMGALIRDAEWLRTHHPMLLRTAAVSVAALRRGAYTGQRLGRFVARGFRRGRAPTLLPPSLAEPLWDGMLR